MTGTVARSVRWFVPVVFLLGMMACGLPGAIAPGGEPAVDEPAEAASTAESAGEDASGLPPTQAPEAVTEPPTTIEPAADQESAAPPPAESVESISVVPLNANTAFILDASGSMLAGLGDKSRLLVAQDAITKLSDGLPTAIKASLWVYGHRVEQDDKAASCQDIEQVIPLGPVDPARFDSVAHSYGAKGYTPISESIRQAAASLPKGESERNTIVLVSDGEETCDADPCALAAELANIDQVVIHTIGLDVDDVARAQLQCIADATGGTYRDADDAEGLELALEDAADAAAAAGGIVTGLGRPTSVTVSPDGQHVYVTSGEAESVVVFSRDPGTGALTYVEAQVNGVDGVFGMGSPMGLALSSDGRHVYVTGGDELAVAIFSRNPDTGALTFVEAQQDGFSGVDGIDFAQAVAVSPDGQSVYLAGADWYDTGEANRPADAVAVFSRDPDTGRLTLVEVHQNGMGGLEGLHDVTWVTVSPDNKSVYAVNTWETVAVFSRDPGTGALTYVETEEAGVGGVVGLLGAQEVVVSPDGGQVYVASSRSSAVTVFGRDPGTGALTFVEAQERGVGSSADDLDGAHGVAVSPDGGHVYVVSNNSDRLLSFGRNPDTGALAYVETLTDNVGGVDGLDGAQSVAVSPDNKHVYAVGFKDDAVAVFRRDAATGRLAFVQVIADAK